jgi:sugar O-acyltransferase (sialic acid O-acetyltransferase NeuD family)
MKYNFNIILIGAGDSAVEIVDYILNDKNFNFKKYFIKIFDKNLKNRKYFYRLNKNIKLESINKFSLFKDKNSKALITFGDPQLRKKYKSILVKKKIKLFKLIHSSSYVSRTSKIFSGAVICPMSVIGSFAEVKENVYINSGALIGHHSVIKQNSIISPNCFFGGNTKIGNNGFVGAGTNVYPGVKIGDDCKIAAGSSIIKNIPKNSFVYGNPAVYLKKNK